MNILVTGGLGFIGSHLVCKLLELKHRVFVIDNLSTGSKKNKFKGAFYYYFDLKTTIKDKKKLTFFLNEHGIETVYHLAANASVNASIANPMKMIDENLNVSISLIEATKGTQVRRFVFASTSAVYGEPKYLPVDENHPTTPISPYGISKLLFENYLAYFGGINDLPIYALRLPNVYGPRQRADLEGGVIAIFNEKMRANEGIKIFGTGNQKRDWVFVEDIVVAMIKTLDLKQKFLIISLGSGIENSVKDLFNFLRTKLSYNKDPIMCAARPADINKMVMDYKKARRILNWSPKVKLEEGILRLE